VVGAGGTSTSDDTVVEVRGAPAPSLETTTTTDGSDA
jgi:hypothetical protein